MKDGPILNKDLKMTNISELTIDRVKKLTADEVGMILMGLTETESKMIAKMLSQLARPNLTEEQRNDKYILIGQLIDVATYRIEQRQVFLDIKKREK